MSKWANCSWWEGWEGILKLKREGWKGVEKGWREKEVERGGDEGGGWTGRGSWLMREIEWSAGGLWLHPWQGLTWWGGLEGVGGGWAGAPTLHNNTFLVYFLSILHFSRNLLCIFLSLRLSPHNALRYWDGLCSQVKETAHQAQTLFKYLKLLLKFDN